MNNVVELNDHRCFVCSCGSVHFHLLSSGKIQCSDCNFVHSYTWCETDYINTLEENIKFLENKLDETEKLNADLIYDYDRLENSLDSCDE